MAQAPKEASFVLNSLGLRKGQKILDLCCGTGRHSLEFARRGLAVVGLDATEDYLRDARKLSRGQKNIEFVSADMRALRFKNEFDAAVNLWTSFGYFLDPADDLLVLKGVARALKPGGRFLIDVVNADWVKRNKLTKHWERLEDGSIRLEEMELQKGRDFSQINKWTVIRRGRPPAAAVFFLRLYDYERMSRLMRRAGFIPLRAWGGLDGHPLDKDASHLVVLGRKAGL